MNTQHSEVGASPEIDKSSIASQPIISERSEHADWTDASFFVRSAVDGMVTGHTRRHFGVSQDTSIGRWMVFHLPTGQWTGLALITSEDARACCTFLEGIDTNWSISDKPLLEQNEAARLAVRQLRTLGLAGTQAALAVQRQNAARRRAIPFNRSAIFDALAAASVTRVTVPFEGYGSNGEIGTVTAWGPTGRTELPSSRVGIKRVAFNQEDPVDTEAEVGVAIKEFCSASLEESHLGWKVDEGSFGDFTFNVCCRTIQMIFKVETTVLDTTITEV